MRWAAVLAVGLLFLGAGCLEGTRGGKTRSFEANAQENEAPIVPAGPTPKAFSYSGTSRSAICNDTAAVCAPIGQGTNAPWRIKPEGDLVRIVGSVDDEAGNVAIGMITVWLLDDSSVLHSVQSTQFDFPVPPQSPLYLDVTFDNSGLGPLGGLRYVEAREFSVDGTLWIR